MKAFFLSILMALSLFATSAQADEWVIPGKVVIDETDDISDNDQESLFSELRAAYPDIQISPSAMESETKIEIGTLSDDEVSDLIQKFKHDKRIQNLEPLYKMEAYGLVNLAKPNDPEYTKQWGMHFMHAESAWGYSTGQGVVVAVIDTGVDCELSDLKGHCIGGYNIIDNNDDYTDRQSHGSHVAGTVMETANNDLLATGLAYNAKLLAVKVLSDSGSGSDLSVSDGIRWAADHDAQILSLSLGGPMGSNIGRDAVKYALDKGVTIVAAAGNSSGGPVGFPAAYPGVIAVSALAQDGSLAQFSSIGPEVFISSPGKDIIQQTICQNSKDCPTKSFSGTSMACPAVSGQISLLVAQGVTDRDAIKDRLRASSTTNSETTKNPNKFGVGLADAGRAVAQESNRQAFWRLGFMTIFAFLVFRKTDQKIDWRFIVPALLSGVGLFFVPWVISLPHPLVFALTRPLVEATSLYSVRLTTWLPLANVVLPGLFCVATWHLKRARMATTGIAAGVASYLASLLAMKTMFFPLGWAITVPFIVVNIVGCFMIAKFNLKHLHADKEEQSKEHSENV